MRLTMARRSFIFIFISSTFVWAVLREKTTEIKVILGSLNDQMVADTHEKEKKTDPFDYTLLLTLNLTIFMWQEVHMDWITHLEYSTSIGWKPFSLFTICVHMCSVNCFFLWQHILLADHCNHVISFDWTNLLAFSCVFISITMVHVCN